MSRWIAFFICAVLGLITLFWGLMMPVHLRALDSSVMAKAGRKSMSLTEEGLKLLQEKKLGPAQLLFRGGQTAEIPDVKKLGQAADDLAIQQLELQVWGSSESGPIGAFFKSSAGSIQWQPGQPLLPPEPFMEFIIRSENREKALELLSSSTNPLTIELLKTRTVTNTTIFTPSQSASGQAFDAIIYTCSLLAESGHVTSTLSNGVFALAAKANERGDVQVLEQFLVELTSLAQRLNWGQLATLIENIKEPKTVEFFGDLIRNNNSTGVIYSSVELSKNGDDVAKYLMKFGDAGVSDLKMALRYDAGGVVELTKQSLRFHQSAFREHMASVGGSKQFFNYAVDYGRRAPEAALITKWILFLVSGFLMAAALHFAKPAVSALERPLQVRGVHLAREALFALGFLVVVVLLTEPFLSQDSQKMGFPFRLRLPMVGGAVPTGVTAAITTTNMNSSILTMVLFFVLQSLLYVSSLVKLAEIRRQRVPARTKLKLLENEDHLFDAGLYLGFLGTIISLILVSLGVFKQPSLMAAYSSTSFGILFVVLFKVVHLRPARRHLLLESEADLTDKPMRIVPPTPSETTLAAPL
jgi:hypothetical protein